MKVNEDLTRKFLSLNQWKDLEGLVDFYYKVVKKGEENILDIKTIAFLLFNQSHDKYIRYTIRKNNGSERAIHAPKKKLKFLQQIINECMQASFTPRSAAHGFVKERSIVTNAKNHVKRKYVYNIDLENFFPTISFHRVVGVFKSFPFRFDIKMARHLANLCCHEGILPQGAPTSPVISNLICRSLDRNLWNLAKTNRVRYSRYADDITFSANQNVFTEQFLTELEDIIKKENFSINRDKVRLQRSHERQVVTGIVVNEMLSVKKKYKKDLRFLISLVKKGKDNAEFSAQAWLDANYKNRQRYFGNVPSIEAVISGKLEFMRMVVGDERLKKHSFYKTAEELGLIEDKHKKKKDLKTIDDQNKEWQEECIGRWKKYFEENDKYLISAIDFDKVIEPEKMLDDQFVVENKVVDGLKHKRKYYVHSPHKLIKKLSQFRSHSNPYGRLVHGNQKEYSNVVSEAKKELRKLYNNKQEQFPPEIYRSLKHLLEKLDSSEYLKKFSTQNMEDIFPKISSNVYEFNRTYRFGDSQDQQKLKNMLLYLLGNTETLKLYKYLEITNNIDSDFTVMTSTRNIYMALKTILMNCQKHSRGVGALLIKLSKKANRSLLRLIDIGSYTNKNPEEIKTGGGDFERLKALLWCYCDFNIYTVYGGENYKVPLLPTALEVEQVDEKIDGFTYEFVFYHPLKILLIDDGLDGDAQLRIKQYERLLKRNHEYGNIVDAEKSTDKSLEELHRYNAVFMHFSYPRFEELKPQLIKEGIPLISFSGGKSNHFDDKKPNFLTLDVNDFYIHLRKFLNQLEEDQQVDLGKLYTIVQNKNDSSEKTTVESIKKRIEDNGLSYPELSIEVYETIKKLTKLEKIRKFKSRKDLSLFLEDF